MTTGGRWHIREPKEARYDFAVDIKPGPLILYVKADGKSGLKGLLNWTVK